MNIESRWRFVRADFSRQAAGHDTEPGFVVLVRCPEDRARWHEMAEDDEEWEDGLLLYVTAYGMTIEDAITEANRMAARAKPIK